MSKRLSAENFIERAKARHGEKYNYHLTKYKRSSEKVTIICRIHGEFSIAAYRHCDGYGCKVCDSTKKFIQKAIKKHGDRYDYSKSEYIDSKTEVKIICPEHGEFLQLPTKHYIGQGCKYCYKKRKNNFANKFIEKAIVVHGNKYDYSLVEYIGSTTKVKIICNKKNHGIFEQSPNSHLFGHGCQKCGNKLKNKGRVKSTEQFIIEAKEIHKNRYEYSNVDYKGNKQKVEIICQKHGSFLQIPSSHLSGAGCSKCRYEVLSEKNRLTNSEFIRKSMIIHKDKYSYLKTLYVKDKKKVIITCPVHGDFEQNAGSHTQGKGCRKCAIEAISIRNAMSTEDFIKKAQHIHGNKYDYNLVEYNKTHKNIKIICKEHGVFEQEPANHLVGKGCPRCSHQVSSGENEIAEWLESLGIKIIKSTRKIISPKEIDIYLPEYKLGIEYNGAYWHSERWEKGKNYHKKKTESAINSGIHLMQFWDVEWKNKKNIVKSIILNKIGVWDNRYFARKLKLKSVHTKKSRLFCEDNHIHGFRGGVKHNGLYDGDELLALMITANSGEMVRFVIKNNCTVIGGFSKLLKYSDVKYSFVDQRIFNGHGYFKNGFKLLYTTPPNYFYTKGRKMETRIKYQKHKLSGILENFNENLSESENMKNNGFYKIFDCGHLKMVLDK